MTEQNYSYFHVTVSSFQLCFFFFFVVVVVIIVRPEKKTVTQCSSRAIFGASHPTSTRGFLGPVARPFAIPLHLANYLSVSRGIKSIVYNNRVLVIYSSPTMTQVFGYRSLTAVLFTKHTYTPSRI